MSPLSLIHILLQYDSLREIVAPVIEHENVVAVGGLVRLSNGIKIKDGRLTHYSLPKKIIPAMQVLEYDRSFLSARIPVSYTHLDVYKRQSSSCP